MRKGTSIPSMLFSALLMVFVLVGIMILSTVIFEIMEKGIFGFDITNWKHFFRPRGRATIGTNVEFKETYSRALMFSESVSRFIVNETYNGISFNHPIFLSLIIEEGRITINKNDVNDYTKKLNQIIKQLKYNFWYENLWIDEIFKYSNVDERYKFPYDIIYLLYEDNGKIVGSGMLNGKQIEIPKEYDLEYAENKVENIILFRYIFGFYMTNLNLVD